MNFDPATLKLVANILVIVGALNWLSIGAQGVNYVSQYAGPNDKYVYLLVGLAGAYLLYNMIVNYTKSGKLEALTAAELLALTEEKKN
jgi:uncharacterized membrane protein YuzA (DUF378 family)